ncbi:hypothetical protein BCV72DRAFT_199996 [Rhizopus microsporus var. microsporus]|uniref:Uncharacterized protein n=1 Tax=Rhizopus microsporus var. microsporus TaxID=86635 RepID=A0A1X0RE55_RHIZD|nr:hypothetical protein BCV72DRAFT_199996 [Rhizopus microsporus var. microsporus]
MSYNNNTYNNQDSNAFNDTNPYNNEQPSNPRHDRADRLNNQLSENQGISATGLNDPYTHASAPTRTQGTTSERNDPLNYSGAPIADTRKVDQTSYDNNAPGMYNPSEGNRTAGTGIPSVTATQNIRCGGSEGGRFGEAEQRSDVTDLPGSRSQGQTGTGHTGSALAGDHGASHHSRHQGNVGGIDERRGRDDTMVSGGPTAASGTGATGTSAPGHYTDDHPTSTSDIDRKPTAGEKIKGNLEKMAGKLTGNEARAVKGDNIAHGRTA